MTHRGILGVLCLLVGFAAPLPNLPKVLEDAGGGEQAGGFFDLWKYAIEKENQNSFPAVTRFNTEEAKTILAPDNLAYVTLFPQDASNPFYGTSKELTTLRESFVADHLVPVAMSPADPRLGEGAVSVRTISGREVVFQRDENDQLSVNGVSVASESILNDGTQLYILRDVLFNYRQKAKEAFERESGIAELLKQPTGPPIDISEFLPSPPGQNQNGQNIEDVFPPGQNPNIRGSDSSQNSQNGQNGSQNGQHGSQNGQHGSQNGQHGSQNGQNGSQNGQHGSQNGQNGSSHPPPPPHIFPPPHPPPNFPPPPHQPIPPVVRGPLPPALPPAFPPSPPAVVRGPALPPSSVFLPRPPAPPRSNPRPPAIPQPPAPPPFSSPPSSPRRNVPTQGRIRRQFQFPGLAGLGDLDPAFGPGAATLTFPRGLSLSPSSLPPRAQIRTPDPKKEVKESFSEANDPLTSIDRFATLFQFSSKPSDGIVATLQREGLTTLLVLFETTGLLNYLISGERGPYIVLAPSEIAFSRLTRSDLRDLSRGNDLSYHLIPLKGQTAPEVTNDSTFVTSLGQKLRFNIYDGNVFVNGAKISRGDLSFNHGTIQVVESVLKEPIGDVKTVLATSGEGFSRINTLLPLLDLNLPESYTILAPPDSAITSKGYTWPDLLNNKDKAKDLLSRHIIEGTWYSEGLLSARTLTTLAGTSLIFRRENDGTVSANGVPLLSQNMTASNGVVHLAADVLPESDVGMDPTAIPNPLLPVVQTESPIDDFRPDFNAFPSVFPPDFPSGLYELPNESSFVSDRVSDHESSFVSDHETSFGSDSVSDHELSFGSDSVSDQDSSFDSDHVSDNSDEDEGYNSQNFHDPSFDEYMRKVQEDNTREKNEGERFSSQHQEYKEQILPQLTDSQPQIPGFIQPTDSQIPGLTDIPQIFPQLTDLLKISPQLTDTPQIPDSQPQIPGFIQTDISQIPQQQIPGFIQPTAHRFTATDIPQIPELTNTPQILRQPTDLPQPQIPGHIKPTAHRFTDIQQPTDIPQLTDIPQITDTLQILPLFTDISQILPQITDSQPNIPQISPQLSDLQPQLTDSQPQIPQPTDTQILSLSQLPTLSQNRKIAGTGNFFTAFGGTGSEMNFEMESGTESSEESEENKIVDRRIENSQKNTQKNSYPSQNQNSVPISTMGDIDLLREPCPNHIQHSNIDNQVPFLPDVPAGMTVWTGPNVDEKVDVLDLLERLNLTKFRQLVDLSGLDLTLNLNGPWTIFAPTNEALDSIPHEAIDQILSHRGFLRRLVSYHIAPGHFDSGTFRPGLHLPTLHAGYTLVLNYYVDGPVAQRWVAGGSVITNLNEAALNGVIHVIDRVLYAPYGDILTTIALSPLLTTVTKIVAMDRELQDYLSGPEPLTVFLPTDDALRNTTLPGDPQGRREWLRSHVVEGNWYTVGFDPVWPFVTLTNTTIQPQLSPQLDRVTVNGILVSYADITASNGVIHVLESPLYNPT